MSLRSLLPPDLKFEDLDTHMIGDRSSRPYLVRTSRSLRENKARFKGAAVCGIPQQIHTTGSFSPGCEEKSESRRRLSGFLGMQSAPTLVTWLLATAAVQKPGYLGKEHFESCHSLELVLAIRGEWR